MKKFNKSEIAFENPEHDFPQHIIYRKVNADSLVAHIEGMEDGTEKHFDFPMKRTRCS